MSVIVREGYIEQNLPDRYIKARVLENFIKDRIDEFGSEWAWRSLREHHTIWVKRLLTADEIRQIEKTSYPQYFAANEEFED
ncbi:hypothetical protein MMC22_009235 [Lobaria immixta]|nr:hypothetical protein [Lobaria immixta]